MLTAPCYGSARLGERQITVFGAFGGDYVKVYRKDELDEARSYLYSQYKYAINGDINNLTSMDTVAQQVLVRSLCTLYNEARNFRGTDAPYDIANDFVALRMHIALSDKKIIFLYEPIIIKSNAPANGPGITTLDCHYITTTGNRYKIQADTFALATDAADLILAYKKQNGNLFMYHNSSTDTGCSRSYIDENCQGASNDTGYYDINYTTLPFQYIFQMYEDNVATPSDGDLISFAAIATNDFSNTYSTFKIHTLIYYKIGVMPHDDDYPFSSFGADFTQMCPPQCGGTTITSTQ